MIACEGLSLRLPQYKCVHVIIVHYRRTHFKHLYIVMLHNLNDVYSHPRRLLVGRARRIAQQYQLQHNESIPVSQLVQKLATVVQEFTQSGSVGQTAMYSTDVLYYRSISTWPLTNFRAIF